MITVLNFCHKDRDLALNLLRQMQEIGVCRNHEFWLQCNLGAAAMGMHQELVLLSKEMFEKAEFRLLDSEDERPWPFAANNAWRDFVYFARTTLAKPWLWLEPDCVFIPRGGCPLCQIQRQYEGCGKPFMGYEVTKPQHRMSGVGVYPAYVVGYTRRLPNLVPAHGSKKHAVAWDQYLASEIVPNAAFTPLIQHVWNVELGKPETIPTFPDQESLKLIGPQTILFHRNKDGTLIERLRERESSVRVAQMGYIAQPSEKLGDPLPAPVPITLDWPHDHEANQIKADAAKREADLLKKIEELQAKLGKSALVVRSAPKKVRTPEQKSADAARMAKVRAARKHQPA